MGKRRQMIERQIVEGHFVEVPIGGRHIVYGYLIEDTWKKSK
jgi:hypothetical protein